ncbi:hypothetical protein [Thalassotalea agarivorans]|uniref:Uncharacterized protein n=1 Tax=Thalassotalea agarivorans TaxID=349064 RepID=A0A1I0EK00_THASX|nr:hypothetical protein [Thalassotalea agarivorans]SET45493.1 hypothetical protein SAMN05660429_01824 [Thalassotalea agarivorans]
MNHINKKVISLCLLASAIFGAQAIVEENIEITVKKTDVANIFVDVNGEITSVKLPKGALDNPEALDSALATLSPEVRSKVKQALSHLSGEADVELEQHVEVKKQVWVTKEDDVEIEMDIDESATPHKKHMVIEATGTIGKDIVARLIDKATLSAEDIEALKQQLDEKASQL